MGQNLKKLASNPQFYVSSTKKQNTAVTTGFPLLISSNDFEYCRVPELPIAWVTLLTHASVIVKITCTNLTDRLLLRDLSQEPARDPPRS